jgi:beta-xylosidase
VIHAEPIAGPWSEPLDLRIEGCIDPADAVGEDVRRCLFFNGVRRARGGTLARPLAKPRGGLGQFYEPRACLGIGVSQAPHGGQQRPTFNDGQEQPWMRAPLPAGRVHLRISNHDHVLTFHHSRDGRQSTQHRWQMASPGYHQNMFGGFLSLRIALFAIGKVEVRLLRFGYRGVPA